MNQLTYLQGYPENLLSQVRSLIAEQKLGAVLEKRYPGTHDFATDKALWQYTQDLKNQYLKSAPPINKVMYDNKIHVLKNALGLHTAISRVQGGKLKALAVTTKTRSPSAPDIPTMEESGVAPFDVSSWFGLIAPKGTPKEAIDKINKAVNAAFDKPEVKEAYAKLGAVSEKNTPQQYSEFIKHEVASWAPVVKASGAKVD